MVVSDIFPRISRDDSGDFWVFMQWVYGDDLSLSRVLSVHEEIGELSGDQKWKMHATYAYDMHIGLVYELVVCFNPQLNT